MKLGKLPAFGLAFLLLGGCLRENPKLDKKETEEPPSTTQGAEPVKETPESSRLFSIELPDGSTWVVDETGKTIPKEKKFIKLKDASGESVQCQLLINNEITDEFNDWGQPITRTLTAVYGLDGSLLWDWEEISYEPGFGDFIIRHTPLSFMASPMAEAQDGNYQTALWNFKTGEVLIDGASNVQPMGDGTYLILDTMTRPMGILDQDGNAVSGFPMPADYYQAIPWNGYVVANVNNPYETEKENRKSVILTTDWEVVLEGQNINSSYYAFRGDYFLYENGDEIQILSDPKGEPLYSYSRSLQNLQYFDGEVLVYSEDSNGQQIYTLADMDGNKLATGFSFLIPSNGHMDAGTADYFAAVLGDTIVKLDRAGKTTATVDMPDVNSLDALGRGMLSYTIVQGDQYTTGVLGKDLEIIIPAGTYSAIYFADSWTRQDLRDLDWLVASRSLQDSYRLDVLDPSGRCIIDNISTLWDVGEDQFAVTRGFQAGLMDSQGNWIVSQSIFNSLLDD